MPITVPATSTMDRSKLPYNYGRNALKFDGQEPEDLSKYLEILEDVIVTSKATSDKDKNPSQRCLQGAREISPNPSEVQAVIRQPETRFGSYLEVANWKCRYEHPDFARRALLVGAEAKKFFRKVHWEQCGYATAKSGMSRGPKGVHNGKKIGLWPIWQLFQTSGD
ncbi:hypothetical protein B0H17DRAFT_1137252 [Mycena rosella]|uniref:Uncharacterized protein n=1 Tax=Mycena rosella TaxID=1033263 RepID=A0AAD7GAX4_MYCRO|nr:hypothetical protein B0H17DRAFT_1137252 [Mycena rosella]